jgi:hypothetical protein
LAPAKECDNRSTNLNHFLDILFPGFESQRPHGHLQVFRVDAAVALGVEEVERLSDVGLL